MLRSQSEIAKSIATKAHQGQFDKAGRPYIEHPAFVASSVNGDKAKAAAWLHDVVEDTQLSFNDLSDAGICKPVIEALKLLTHRDGVDYFDYIKAIKKNKTATLVKLADLAHNSDLSRLKVVTEKDEQRRTKYLEAINILLS